MRKPKRTFAPRIEIYPRNVNNYVSLGTQYEKEGNWEEAKKLYEKAHDIDSGAPFVSDELAFLYLEHSGDVNVALSLAQMARQRLPNSPVTADALGWAYYKMGAYESAVSQLRECVQKVPDNPVYQYHLGMAYIVAGHRDSAAQSLQKALQNDPDFPFAARARATLGKISKGPAFKLGAQVLPFGPIDSLFFCDIINVCCAKTERRGELT